MNTEPPLEPTPRTVDCHLQDTGQVLYKAHALGTAGTGRAGDLGLLQGCLPGPGTFEGDFEE